MIDAMMMLAPCAKMLAVLAVARLGWLALGDLILEHVGIPFLDASAPRGVTRSAAHERASRRTGMSRAVRAW